MNYSDDDLRRILAGGKLGGPARERVLERVLDRVAPRARLAGRRPWLLGVALAIGSGIAAVVLVARPQPYQAGEDFRAKGGRAGASAVALDVRCAQGQPTPCQRGSTLRFSVFGAATPGYLGAYAQSMGGAGERIWYFSAETESPPVPPSAQATQPAGRGIVIGPEHAPGRFTVHLFLSSAPLPEAVLLTGSDPRILARATIPLTIASP